MLALRVRSRAKQDLEGNFEQVDGKMRTDAESIELQADYQDSLRRDAGLFLEDLDALTEKSCDP